MPKVNIPSNVYRSLQRAAQLYQLPFKELLQKLSEIASACITPIEGSEYPEADKAGLIAQGFKSVADADRFHDDFHGLLSDAEREVLKQQIVEFFENDLRPFLGAPSAIVEGEEHWKGLQFRTAYDAYRKENTEKPSTEFREIRVMDFPDRDVADLEGLGIYTLVQVGVILKVMSLWEKWEGVRQIGEIWGKLKLFSENLRILTGERLRKAYVAFRRDNAFEETIPLSPKTREFFKEADMSITELPTYMLLLNPFDREPVSSPFDLLKNRLQHMLDDVKVGV